MNPETRISEMNSPDEIAGSKASISGALLGRVVRVHDGAGGARIQGTSVLALHAVLAITGDSATVALLGDDNLSEVPVTALMLATPEDLADCACQVWDRSAPVTKSRARRPNGGADEAGGGIK
jgi:hypothetical protein